MNYCEFGDTLKSLRKGHNLTQQELGAKIGLSKAVVSKYENGMGYPSYDILIRIAQFFGVTTDYLLGVSGGKAMDVSGLTDSQLKLVHALVLEFRKTNKI